jgi:hypothetical protein
MEKWLKMNNTCPECRKEIDEDHDIFTEYRKTRAPVLNQQVLGRVYRSQHLPFPTMHENNVLVDNHRGTVSNQTYGSALINSSNEPIQTMRSRVESGWQTTINSIFSRNQINSISGSNENTSPSQGTFELTRLTPRNRDHFINQAPPFFNLHFFSNVTPPIIVQSESQYDILESVRSLYS